MYMRFRRRNNMNKKIIFALIVACIIIVPSFILAADAPTVLEYSPPYISGVPGFDKASTGAVTDQTKIQDYLVRIYQFAIGISGITAVGMIVWGAINMSIYTGRIDRYEEGKTIIYQALLGLALLFGSYLLLQTINPEITQLKEPGSGLGVKLENLVKDAPPSIAKSSQECGGGNLATIQLIPSLGTTDPVAKGCEYKRLKLTSAVTIKSNAIYSNSKTLDAGTIVWLWPYYESAFKDKKSAAERCVIYAYKEPPKEGIDCGATGEAAACKPSGVMTPQSTEMVSLNLDKLIKCSNNPSLQQDGAPLDSDVANSSATGAEAELLKHSVTVTSSGNCRDINNKTCTSLEGMPASAISYLSNLGDWCFNNNCEVTVTGGTEIGHVTHGPGKAVFDLSSTGSGASTLGQHLKNDSSVKVICVNNADIQYQKNCAGFDETIRHFHVQL